MKTVINPFVTDTNKLYFQHIDPQLQEDYSFCQLLEKMLLTKEASLFFFLQKKAPKALSFRSFRSVL
jgi:hypothetical protein